MNNLKYDNSSFSKQVEKINLYKWKWISIIFLILPSIIFNIIYNFCFIKPNINSNVAGNYQVIFLLGTGLFMIVGFFLLLSKCPSLFTKSGMIILPLFWVSNNIFIPFVIAPIMSAILTIFFPSHHVLFLLNLEGTFFQIILYIFIIWYFFKFCTIPANRFLKFIFPQRKIKKEKIKIVNNIKIQILIIIMGIVLAFLLNTFFSLFVNSNINPKNQKNIDNLSNNTFGYIFIVFLTLILAPIVEECATRNGIIFLLNSQSPKVEQLNYLEFNKKTLKKPFFFISIFLSIIFFSNMHIEFDYFINIFLYIGPAIALTIVYCVSGFNTFASIFSHGIFNLIILFMNIFPHN